MIASLQVLAMQLIKTLHKIWVEARLPVFLRPYDVVAVSNSTGLIETVPDAVSLDSIKKSLPSNATLLQYFTQVYGAVDSPTFRMAQRNFTESLVGYSILTYLLQVFMAHSPRTPSPLRPPPPPGLHVTPVPCFM